MPAVIKLRNCRSKNKTHQILNIITYITIVKTLIILTVTRKVHLKYVEEESLKVAL